MKKHEGKKKPKMHKDKHHKEHEMKEMHMHAGKEKKVHKAAARSR